jgi:hypothetical protein
MNHEGHKGTKEINDANATCSMLGVHFELTFFHIVFVIFVFFVVNKNARC